MANKWPTFYHAIANKLTLPTWQDFLEIVVDSSSVSFNHWNNGNNLYW